MLASVLYWNSLLEVSGAPLGFFQPFSFVATESWYSMFDWELLAVYMATQHFWLSTEGHRHTFYTAHHSLAQAVGRLLDSWSPQQEHHLSALAVSLANILHLPSCCSSAADALSHSPVSAFFLGVDYHELAWEQRVSADVCANLTAITGLILREVFSLRTLSQLSTAHIVGPSWNEQLLWVPLIFCSAIQSDLDGSAMDMVLHHSPLLPGEPFHQNSILHPCVSTYVTSFYGITPRTSTSL